MRLRHKSDVLARLEVEPSYKAEGAYSKGIIGQFRKVMGILRNAVDERDLGAFNALRYKPLQKPRDHQHSVRINDQFRLILEWEGKGETRTLTIVGIEDYH